MSFWKGVGQSAVTTASDGLVKNIVNLPFNALYRKWQDESNSRMMQEQHRLNIASYMTELAQESPEAQVQRLKNARLHPALMYGGSPGTSINASVGSTAGAPAGMSHPVAGVSTLSDILRFQKLDAEVDNLLADSEKKRQDAKESRSRQQINEDRAGVALELLRSNLRNDQLSADIRAIEKEFAKGLNEANLDYIKSKSLDLRNQITNRNKVTDNDARRVQAYCDDVESLIHLRSKQAETEEFKQRNIVSDTGLKQQQKKTEDAREDFYRSSAGAQDALADKYGKEYAILEQQLENYDLRLYSELAKMTSEELRQWTDILVDWRKMSSSDEFRNKSYQQRKREHNDFMLLQVLPFLFRLATK